MNAWLRSGLQIVAQLSGPNRSGNQPAATAALPLVSRIAMNLSPRDSAPAAPFALQSAVGRAVRSVLSSGVSSLLVAGLLLPAATLQAQAGRPGLISQPVNESRRTTLTGN